MVLSDMGWHKLAEEERSVVYPYHDRQIRLSDGRRRISYGQSSAGYDLTLDAKEILVPKPGAILDPKCENIRYAYNAIAPTIDKDQHDAYWYIPPGGSALALTVETIDIPRDHVGICVGKSTYARCGLLVNTTPLEPEWRGRLVLELHNIQQHNSIRVYGNEGIAQLLLFRIDGPIFTSYADRRGKYQNQDKITPARV